ncbi:MAG TPA: hypothetical protein VJS12_27300 [Steroidobacteraceae bacterium]|nr:hypothetical protein [Steroidobacteraceae bacterium]
MPPRCTSTFVLAAAVLLGVGAARADADVVPPALQACVNVKNKSERLACYDRTIQQLSSDSAAATPQRSAEASFGASSMRGSEPAQKIEREELTAVSAHITALSRDASGALVINLDNGQQWRQTSGSGSPLLEVGHEVTISRAALNSFRMSTPSGRVLKVKRVL